VKAAVLVKVAPLPANKYHTPFVPPVSLISKVKVNAVEALAQSEIENLLMEAPVGAVMIKAEPLPKPGTLVIKKDPPPVPTRTLSLPPPESGFGRKLVLSPLVKEPVLVPKL
jgi:hypothetical protein